MKLFKAVLLCLALCVGAWGKDMWLSSCRVTLGYLDLDTSTCAPLLKKEATRMLEKKEFKYDISIEFEGITKQEEKAIKNAIESALLRYFSTPAYPKKIKEVKRGKELPDIILMVRAFRYNDIQKIYYGDISGALAVGPVFSGMDAAYFPIAFHRETQFSVVGNELNYLIESLSNRLFKAINE